MNTNKLKGKLAERGYSQRSFAAKVGMSKNTLNLKINGKGVFNTVEINSICKELGIVSNAEKAEIFLANSSQNRDKRIESKSG